MGKHHKKIKAGDCYNTNQGCTLEVLAYTNANNVDVIFHENGFKKTTTAVEIRRGTVKNPYYPSVAGIGYLGEGVYQSRAGTKTPKTPEYSLWSGVLSRCYYRKTAGLHTAYEGVTVAECWHNFQNMAEWCQHQIGFGREGWDIDKDALVRGNKVYGPDTCCFLPQEINRMLSGILTGCAGYSVRKNGSYRVRCRIDGKEVTIGHFTCKDKAFLAYKDVKEKEIKRLANKWKSEIDPRAYCALMDFEILQEQGELYAT